MEGLKGAVGVAVGEKHSLALQAWHQGPLLDVTWAGEAADAWPAFSPSGFPEEVWPKQGYAGMMEEEGKTTGSATAKLDAVLDTAYINTLNATYTLWPAVQTVKQHLKHGRSRW